jgi:predicted Rossmann fold nucleotide-binding protein DprA/Smf involved in DNA uptake
MTLTERRYLSTFRVIQRERARLQRVQGALHDAEKRLRHAECAHGCASDRLAREATRKRPPRPTNWRSAIVAALRFHSLRPCEIVERTGIPSGSIHHRLLTLLAEGSIVRTIDSRYSLSAAEAD